MGRYFGYVIFSVRMANPACTTACTASIRMAQRVPAIMGYFFLKFII